ncbi:hypothetical protein P7C70_g4524, partial [Phenoliferia sp. Uapishka_3]
MGKQGSVEVGPPAEKGEGRARRAFVCPDTLTARPAQKDAQDVAVLADILVRSVRLYGDQNALGWRDTIRMVSEDKEVTKVIGGKKTTETKTWSYFELSDYKYMTYSELGAKVKDVASTYTRLDPDSLDYTDWSRTDNPCLLPPLGALVETGHSKDTIFNIYASTSPKWQIMANVLIRVLASYQLVLPRASPLRLPTILLARK